VGKKVRKRKPPRKKGKGSLGARCRFIRIALDRRTFCAGATPDAKLEAALDKLLPSEKQLRKSLGAWYSAHIANAVDAVTIALWAIQDQKATLVDYEANNPLGFSWLSAVLAVDHATLRVALQREMPENFDCGVFAGGPREAAFRLVSEIEGISPRRLRDHLSGSERQRDEASVAGIGRGLRDGTIKPERLREFFMNAMFEKDGDLLRRLLDLGETMPEAKGEARALYARIKQTVDRLVGALEGANPASPDENAHIRQ